MGNHISNVSFERIKPNRMVNNYKVDKDGKVWFLWCSSMRLESNKPKRSQGKAMNAEPLSLNEEIKISDKVRQVYSSSLR
jgi:hypothetical protein